MDNIISYIILSIYSKKNGITELDLFNDDYTNNYIN